MNKKRNDERLENGDIQIMIKQNNTDVISGDNPISTRHIKDMVSLLLVVKILFHYGLAQLTYLARTNNSYQFNHLSTLLKILDIFICTTSMWFKRLRKYLCKGGHIMN